MTDTFGNVLTNVPASTNPTTASVRTNFGTVRTAGVNLETRVQSLETGGGATGGTGGTGGVGGTGGTGAAGASGASGATGASGASGATGVSGLQGATGASGTPGAGGAAVALFGGYIPDGTNPPGPHANGTMFINIAAMTTGGASLYVWDTIAWTPVL